MPSSHSMQDVLEGVRQVQGQGQVQGQVQGQGQGQKAVSGPQSGAGESAESAGGAKGVQRAQVAQGAEAGAGVAGVSRKPFSAPPVPSSSPSEHSPVAAHTRSRDPETGESGGPGGPGNPSPTPSPANPHSLGQREQGGQWGQTQIDTEVRAGTGSPTAGSGRRSLFSRRKSVN
ncbi:hypothetical protein B484DRAFT_142202 [Ochromonadaceae sp. CCMP2298]|nr:hypothetical protein B484DRAFT_142202 [Ochromonadaceae sp. CCMP2298]